MTSLLASVREDEAVKAGRLEVRLRMYADITSDKECEAALDTLDTAFLRAAVREIARRVKAEAKTWKRNKALWMPENIVDFIEGMIE